jgi:hypothetical protein
METSLNAIVSRIEAYADEDSPQNKKKISREWWEIRSLIAAAAVGAVAIIVGSLDAKDNRREMRAEQRPWIKIGFEGAIEPLHFGQDGMTGAFSVAYKNVGHSPALYVRLSRNAVVSTPTSNVRTELRKTCEEGRSKEREGIGFTVFPDGVEPTQIYFTIPQSQIDEAVKSPPDGDKHRFVAYLVGCVSYQAPGSADIHQTPFVAEIDRSLGSRYIDFESLDPSKGDVAPSDIRIMINPKVTCDAD